jgi:hypothetical protein
MADNDLGNLPHHGKIHQPRTMAAMAINLNRFIRSFCEKLIF